MATTKLNLDRQANAQTFTFGTTSASGEGLVTINKGTAAASTTVLDVKGSASIAGDLALTGNLNITGSIDEQSVTNLAVKDLTITTNKGGTTAGAAGAGLKVEGDSAATIAAITYASGSASKFQIGDGTTQKDIVDLSSTQTLTGKSLAGSSITSAVANATTAVSFSGSLVGDVTGTQGATVVGKINGTSLASLGTGILKNTTTTGVPSIAIAADFPTLNQSTTGNALTATTAATSTVTNGIATAGAAVVTNAAAAPSGSGMALVTTSATAATWQTVSTATFKRTTITGTQNGSNTAFTLGNTPATGSEMVIQNGLTLNPGGNDYTLSGTTVTFSVAPQASDVLLAWATY